MITEIGEFSGNYQVRMLTLNDGSLPKIVTHFLAVDTQQLLARNSSSTRRNRSFLGKIS